MTSNRAMIAVTVLIAAFLWAVLPASHSKCDPSDGLPWLACHTATP